MEHEMEALVGYSLEGSHAHDGCRTFRNWFKPECYKKSGCSNTHTHSETMAESLAKARSLLTETCKDPNKIPGAILFAADRSGKTLLHEAAGVRQAGSSEPMS